MSSFKKMINKININSNKIGMKMFFVALLISTFSYNIDQSMVTIMVHHFTLIVFVLELFSVALILIKVFLLDHHSWQYLLVITTIFILLIIGSFNGVSMELFVAFVFIIGATTIDLKSIFKSTFFVMIITLLATMFLSFVGVLPNLVYFRTNGSFPRQALGETYTTVLSSLVFFMLVALVCWKICDKNVINGWLEAGFVLISGTLFYVVTQTRTDLMCTVLLAMIIPWKHYGKIFKNKVVKIITLIMPTLIFIWTIFATYGYKPTSKIWELFDKIFSGRLMFANMASKLFPPKLFGQLIPQVGNGGSTATQLNYFFIDSSFDRVLFMNGIIAFIISFLVLQIAFYKIVKMDNKVYMALLWVFIITMIEGVFSSFFFIIGINSTLFILSIAFRNKNEIII